MRAALVLLALTVAPVAQSTLEQVRSRAEAGEYALARTAAEKESDPFLRAQSEVWLYFRARDFRASLAAAQRGLKARAGDPWLLERAAASAVHLRDAGLAGDWVRRLEQRVSELDASEAGVWRDTLAARADEAQGLARAQQLSRTALARSRWVAGIGLALTGIVCVALAGRLRGG